MNQSNKAILIVLAVLVVVLLVFVVGSGACSGSGGGGGAPSQSTLSQSASSQSVSSQSASSQSSASQQSASQESGSSMNTNSNAGDTEAQYQKLLEELNERLSKPSSPAGENARDVAKATGVTTVAETYKGMSERGFGDLAISGTLTVDGSYTASDELDKADTSRYCSYRAEYLTGANVRWIIVVNEGKYFAVPAATPTTQLSKEIILSEQDRVVKYDAATGQYSDFALNGMSGAVGVKVDRIDKATLDSFTEEELLKL